MPKVKPFKKLIRFGSRFGWCGTCVKAAKKNEPGFCNHNEAVSTDDTLIKKGVINFCTPNSKTEISTSLSLGLR